ncbi:MAG: thioredoxin [Patescibacteria group bacterium]|nr:thioredoxin [Patescibacteria group bacterium]MDD5295187.1 thioredoxin [Patescibacteria group bacterium]MDD5554062.1 thioredoxin [Patescibacteria group bacterium]
MAKVFNDENFNKEVIEASKIKPVLVDFFAVWCGPCKIQGPIIDEVAEEMGDKAIVGKLNTEEAPETSSQYGVMSIPTLILFKGGEPKETLNGLHPKEALAEVIKKYL